MNITSIHIYPIVLSSTVYQVVTQYGDNHIEIPLDGDMSLSSYITKAITGLEVPDVGSFIGNRRPDNNFGALTPRTIDILLTLNPANSAGKTVSELREDVYRIISGRNESEVEVRLMNGATHVANVRGKVKRVDTSLFASKSQISISIECKNPMFVSPDQSVFVIDEEVIPPEFTGGGGHVYGVEYESGAFTIVDDDSNAPHGVHMSFSVAEDLSGSQDFTLETYHNDVLLESLSFEYDYPVGGLTPTIQLSSIYSQIYITVEYGRLSLDSVAHTISSGSVLPSIHPGANSFQIVQNTLFELEYARHYHSYWGV